VTDRLIIRRFEYEDWPAVLAAESAG